MSGIHSFAKLNARSIEPSLYFPNQGSFVRSRLVHLVDKDEHGYLIQAQQPLQRTGMALYAIGTADH